MTDHTPIQLEKYYTCYIERRLHIPYNPASVRLTTGNFFRRVFSECIEAVATSLIPLVSNFPEICALIIGFSFTVRTKMRPLAGSSDEIKRR